MVVTVAVGKQGLPVFLEWNHNLIERERIYWAFKN